MKKLTIKQFKYVDALIRLGNKRAAVLEAGYSAKTRKQADGFVYMLNKNPRVQKVIQERLNDTGITPETIVSKWAEALKSECRTKGTYSDYLRILKTVTKMYGLI